MSDARTTLLDAAEKVCALYPTIAGTSILIRDANRHVPRNAWDDVADAVWNLIDVVQRERHAST